jgi:hypothetical protein
LDGGRQSGRRLYFGLLPPEVTITIPCPQGAYASRFQLLKIRFRIFFSQAFSGDLI